MSVNGWLRAKSCSVGCSALRTNSRRPSATSSCNRLEVPGLTENAIKALNVKLRQAVRTRRDLPLMRPGAALNCKPRGRAMA